MNNLVIHINKKHISKYIIWLILFLSCFGYFFIDVLGVPSLSRYLMDFSNAILLFYSVAYLLKRNQINPRTKSLIAVIALFIISSFLIALLKKVDIILLLWGARNTFRFFTFFVGCTLFLDKTDFEKLYSKINTVLYINFFLCIFEYLVLGLSGDYIGGGFGINQGCNALLNGLLVLATTYNVVIYMNKKIPLFKMVINIGMCTCIAGMSELKVYIVEIVLIIIIIGFMSKGVLKKIAIVLTAILFAFLCIKMVEILVPGWKGFFTVNNMYNMISDDKGYTRQGDLNRLTSVSKLNSVFFRKDINILGYGLGNCEYSDNFSFLNSTFFLNYGYLHYAWFSIAKIFLEMGWYGVILHVLIWSHAIVTVIKRKIVKEIGGLFALTIAIMLMFLFVYNYTVNLDIAYILYAILSSAYVLNVTIKEKKNQYD